MIQLQPSFFKENEIFIQVVCPQLAEVEHSKRKGKKETATKFELWQGVKDLTFIIPRNFSNLSQKSGGHGGGTGGMGGAMGAGEEEEVGEGTNLLPKQNFVGLKSPDHLKKVCNMFRNCDFKAAPQKYMETLRHNINYDNPEIYRGPVKTEIINRVHGGGCLHLKVFKVLNPKSKGGAGGGSSADSDTVRDEQGQNNFNKNIKAMIEEANRRIDELTSEDVLKRIA